MHQIVSVIVPIYNVEKYLQRCIESLIHQTYYALQIILVNDGSTDNSLAIAEQFAALDKRIEIYSQSNLGQAAARNNGLRYATGEWISFVDADDFVETDCYAQLMRKVIEQDVIHFGFRRITQDNEIKYERVPKYHYRYTTPWSRLFRRQWLMDNAIVFPTGMYYEDIIFTMDIWLKRPRQIIIPYVGYNYVLNPTSTTSISHIPDKKRLYDILQKKLFQATSIKQKCIILYTIIRLKLHFMRYD